MKSSALYKKIVCIIPARLASVRFPKKILHSLLDKPLLQWVWEAANATGIFNEIIFAIDAIETAQLIDSFGGKYLMTKNTCQSGTDRLIELCITNKITADIWVNWQADEPFITKDMLNTLLQSIHSDTQEVWTLKKRIQNPNDIYSRQIAKIVCDIHNNALYFSRSPIPCFRDEKDLEKLVAIGFFYKHIGLYAYTTGALHKIANMPYGFLEDIEKLEQLRFLENGLHIKVHTTNQEVFGIDLPSDLIKAETYAKTLSRLN